MAFTNYVPPLLNDAQAGAMPDLIGQLLGGYTDTTKARYLQPNLQEQLMKAQLENKWYEPNMQSQIGLRGAQAGQAGAHTRLLGEQLKSAQKENEFLPQKLQAQIAQMNAQAARARILQRIQEEMIGGPTSGQGQQMPSMGMFQGQGMPMEQAQANPMMQGQMPQHRPSMDFAKAATAMQALGLGHPHVVEANGKYVAITPFGNIDTGISGLTARDTQLAKEDAKKISALENTVLTGSVKQETFNELNTILGSPEFEAVRANPILGRHELAWYKKFGTPEQQRMIGEAQTHMGNIIKESARDFAGQFRVGEQALLNDMKPNPGDSLDVMKGKAEALTYMNELLTKRAELEADLMRNYNMSALQARVAANKEIDPREIKKEIKTILHPAGRSKLSPEQAHAELERRRAAKGG